MNVLSGVLADSFRRGVQCIINSFRPIMDLIKVGTINDRYLFFVYYQKKHNELNIEFG
ncbi:hypothetical protein [Candidatus Nitrosocosmicus sp. R]